MQNKFKLAFTLAEVIITLGIVGIVAEIVIPDLVANTQKQVAVSAVKEIYSILSQATTSIKNDCSGNPAGCLTNPAAGDNDATARTDITNLYKQKLKIVKDCTDGVTKKCFYTNYKYLDNSVYTDLDNDSNWAKFTLTNGMSLAFYWHGSGSPTMYYMVMVDINNTKNPNVFGKDLFEFFYNTNVQAMVPAAFSDCGTGTNQGYGCSSRIIQEGAINYY